MAGCVAGYRTGRSTRLSPASTQLLHVVPVMHLALNMVATIIATAYLLPVGKKRTEKLLLTVLRSCSTYPDNSRAGVPGGVWGWGQHRCCHAALERVTLAKSQENQSTAKSTAEYAGEEKEERRRRRIRQRR
jgi:hypothetical protein